MVGGLSQPAQCFHALSGSQLFIADNRLAEYEIVATRHRARSDYFAALQQPNNRDPARSILRKIGASAP